MYIRTIFLQRENGAMAKADAMRGLAVDLVRAVRGRRSQVDFSRRLGYRSNIAHRWESGLCWPTASAFLTACARVKPATRECFVQFFNRTPDWFDPTEPFSVASVAAFMRELQGKTPIGVLAERTGHGRFGVGRWLRGSAQPKLPEFLRYVDVASRRVLDLVAAIVDPAQLPSVATSWERLQRARQAAYQVPWSHAVLRALELDGSARAGARSERWLAAQLGIEVAEVERGLEVLAATGQIHKVGARWQIERAIAVDTSQDAVRGRQLKAAWTRVALERMLAGAPGNYGYSVFAVSRKDMRRLREIHLQYVRAMQSVIAASEPTECVGLYCAQLLHLSASDNALG
jgi:hypothetical protein